MSQVFPTMLIDNENLRSQDEKDMLNEEALQQNKLQEHLAEFDDMLDADELATPTVSFLCDDNTNHENMDKRLLAFSTPAIVYSDQSAADGTNNLTQFTLREPKCDSINSMQQTFQSENNEFEINNNQSCNSRLRSPPPYFHNEDVNEEYFDQDADTTRQLHQLELLYTARGRTMDGLQDELRQVCEESEREISIMRHQLNLAQSDQIAVQSAYDECKDLLSAEKGSVQTLEARVIRLTDQLENARSEKAGMEERLDASQATIDSLTAQLAGLSSSNSLSRVRAQYEQVIADAKARHADEMAHLSHRLSDQTALLDERASELRSLEEQVGQLEATLRRERTAAGTDMQQVSEKLAETQRRLAELLREDTSTTIAELRLKLDSSAKVCDDERRRCMALEEEVAELKRQLNAYEVAVDECPRKSLPSTDCSPDVTLGNLKVEMQRLLIANKSKREVIHKLNAEVANQKRQIASLSNELSNSKQSLTEEKRLSDNFKSEYNSLKTQVESLLKDQATTKNTADKALQNAKAELRSAHDEVVTLTERLRVAECDLGACGVRLRSADERARGVEKQQSVTLAELAEAKSSLRGRIRDLARTQHELNLVKGEMISLRESKRTEERFTQTDLSKRDAYTQVDHLTALKDATSQTKVIARSDATTNTTPLEGSKLRDRYIQAVQAIRGEALAHVEDCTRRATDTIRVELYSEGIRALKRVWRSCVASLTAFFEQLSERELDTLRKCQQIVRHSISTEIRYMQGKARSSDDEERLRSILEQSLPSLPPAAKSELESSLDNRFETPVKDTDCSTLANVTPTRSAGSDCKFDNEVSSNKICLRPKSSDCIPSAAILNKTDTTSFRPQKKFSDFDDISKSMPTRRVFNDEVKDYDKYQTADRMAEFQFSFDDCRGSIFSNAN